MKKKKVNYVIVFGGETKNPKVDPYTADRVYRYVDVYNAKSKEWMDRADLAEMTYPRHGVWPLIDTQNDFIYVAGGGIKAGNSKSSRNTRFALDDVLDPPQEATAAAAEGGEEEEPQDFFNA